MTNTVYRGLRITEDHEMNIDGERETFKKGDLVTVEENLGRSLVNKARIGEYTGKQYAVNVDEVDGRLIRTGEYVTNQSKGDDEKFDFEEYVDEHNADTVIKDVEDSDSVTWLENLANYDERKTVQSAIDERLEELEE